MVHREVTLPICAKSELMQKKRKKTTKKTKLQISEKQNGDYCKTANFLRVMVNQQV